ncbi:hypothetical protein QA802_06160 [Streptomyces sp. B21-105]
MPVHTMDGNISVRRNVGTYFGSGYAASSCWSNFLGGEGDVQGRLYFG